MEIKKANKKKKTEVISKSKTVGRKIKTNKSKPRAKNKEKMLKALLLYGSIVYKACEFTGISRYTHYKWLQDDKEYASKVDDIKEKRIDMYEEALDNLRDEGNPHAITFALKTIGKNRGYVEKQEIEHSGSFNVEINLVEKSVEEIKEKLKKNAKK